jgi:hypothetical protein
MPVPTLAALVGHLRGELLYAPDDSFGYLPMYYDRATLRVPDAYLASVSGA